MAHWEYCLRAAVWGIKLLHDEDSTLNGETGSSMFRSLQAEVERLLSPALSSRGGEGEDFSDTHSARPVFGFEAVA